MIVSKFRICKVIRKIILIPSSPTAIPFLNVKESARGSFAGNQDLIFLYPQTSYEILSRSKPHVLLSTCLDFLKKMFLVDTWLLFLS